MSYSQSPGPWMDGNGRIGAVSLDCFASYFFIKLCDLKGAEEDDDER